jgi:hypothetical protein
MLKKLPVMMEASTSNLNPLDLKKKAFTVTLHFQQIKQPNILHWFPVSCA